MPYHSLTAGFSNPDELTLTFYLSHFNLEFSLEKWMHGYRVLMLFCLYFNRDKKLIVKIIVFLAKAHITSKIEDKQLIMLRVFQIRILGWPLISDGCIRIPGNYLPIPYIRTAG